MTILALNLLVNLLTSCSRMWVVLNSNVQRSRVLSFQMAFRLVHSSINNFLDRVPMGRILNRFVRELNEIDWSLGYATSYLIWIFCAMMVDCIASVYASSFLMIFFLIAYFYVGIKVQRRYMNLYREATRLKSICSSPMIQAFSEGMLGVTTIRVHKKLDYCLSRYHSILDDFQKNSIMTDALMRWFVLRLFGLSVILLIPAIFMNIFLVRTGPGFFAVLMRYMIVVMSDINEFLDTLSNQENRMISFERCNFFAQIEPEKGYRNLEETMEKLRNGELPEPKKEAWPTSGSLVIEKLKVRYRANLPLVVKGISLKIEHGVKVGILGRTGAGKTTLISSLYRHFDDYEGNVILDGKELRDVDLRVLRSKITIIPQDPYIFQDTVRNNLDPLGLKNDDEVKSVLKEIQLWEKFEPEGGLKAQIDQGGSNLSQGEKQLLCLSRALLHKNKLILMDEATANIDTQSEQTIQKLLKEKFNDSTILMIAHRLNTILHCNKVLVMDQGKILEYGDTEKMRKDTSTFFSKMLSTYEEMQKNLT